MSCPWAEYSGFDRGFVANRAVRPVLGVVSKQRHRLFGRIPKRRKPVRVSACRVDLANQGDDEAISFAGAGRRDFLAVAVLRVATGATMRQACAAAAIAPDGDVVCIPAAAFSPSSLGPTEETACRPFGSVFFNSRFCDRFQVLDVPLCAVAPSGQFLGRGFGFWKYL